MSSYEVLIVDGNDNNPPPRQPDKHYFIDRRKNLNDLLIILAGYKTYLFEDVLARILAFAPKDKDVCIVSSGLFDEMLNRVAAENNWSYLSTTEDNIPLIQNLVIKLHGKAQWIYKMDEDIFITKNSFETMFQTYDRVRRYGHYKVGFVAPLLPVNIYCYIRLLDKLHLLETYEKIFEYALYGFHPPKQMIWANPETAKFFWGEGGHVPSIDNMNATFQAQEFSYSICPVRFSVGFILFHRSLWKAMRGFKLPKPGSAGMGIEEVQMAEFCASHALAVVVAENTVCGHFSYGPQNSKMRKYYSEHREKFICPI